MDAFISYAHEDAEFVHRLRAALASGGREVWVDIEGIEPADRWRGSVHEAIDRSDAFLFVLSRPSVASRACLEELDYAVSVNKRVIAVCIEQAVADVEKPQALDELSWIMMRPEDDFELGVERVVHALDTDLELVRAHTQILVRARAWDLANRRSSPLLRGEELRTAEEWLSRASVGGGPQPTELQREFIVASRHAAARRQATIAGVSAAVALVAVGLSIFALIQRSDAIRSQQIAINNQKVAQSRLLAAEAESTISSDASLSTLLALKALRIHYTVQAEQALRDALANLRTLVVLRGHANVVVRATFSADGTRVLTASADGTARVWNARTGALIVVLRVPPGPNSPMFDASFSPDGSRILTADYNRAIVWDARTGRPLYVLRRDTRSVQGVAFSPDGSRILTAGVSVQVWDARTGHEVSVIRGPAGGVQAAFSPEGSRIVTVFSDGSIRVWDARTGRLLLRLHGTSMPDPDSRPSFSPDGRRILASGSSTGLWDARTGQRLLTLTDPSTVTSDEQDAAFSPDGTRLVTENTGELTVFDAENGNPLFVLRDPTSTVRSVAFSPDGARLVTAESDYTARIWDASSLTEQLIKPDPSSYSNLNDAAFSPDGSELIATARARKAWIWDARTGSLTGTLNDPNGMLASAAFSPDGARIVTTDGQRAQVWDARSGVPRVTFGAGVAPFSASYSSGGAAILTADLGQTATLWNALSGRQLADYRVPAYTYIASAALSPDASRVVVAASDGTARIFKAQTGRQVVVLRGHSGAVNSAAYSPDGSRVVTASADQTSRVWDAHSGSQLLVLSGHTGNVNSAVFSPDGSLVATGGDDQTIRIWNARTGLQLLVFRVRIGAVKTVEFSRDGYRLLSANEGDVEIWSTVLARPIATLERLARSLVTRPFTAQERRTYLAGISG